MVIVPGPCLVRRPVAGGGACSDAPWRAELEAELLSFPAGRNDDQVDMLGLAGQLLDVMTAPAGQKPPPEPVDPWASASRRRKPSAASWKVA